MQQTESELQAELELALLQINQLQEELEYYYLEYSQLKDQNVNNSQNSLTLKLLRQARLNESNYIDCSSEQCKKLQQVELDKKNVELKEFKALLDVRSNEVEILTNKNQQLVEKSQELKAENELVQLQVHQLQEELESTCLHKQKVDEHLQVANNKVEQAQIQTQVEIENLYKTNKELLTQIDDLTSSYELAENEIAELMEVLSQTRENSSDKEVQVVELESSVTELEITSNSLAAQLEEAQLAKKQLQVKIEDLTSSNESAESEIATLTDELSQVKEELTQRREQVVELESEKNEIVEQRDKQTQCHQENKKWAENLKRELESVTQSKTNIAQQLAQLQQKQNELEESLSCKDEKISTLTKEKEELIYRQTLLDTEIVKAEAQLELVKDVVLREKAF